MMVMVNITPQWTCFSRDLMLVFYPPWEIPAQLLKLSSLLSLSGESSSALALLCCTDFWQVLTRPSYLVDRIKACNHCFARPVAAHVGFMKEQNAEESEF